MQQKAPFSAFDDPAMPPRSGRDKPVSGAAIPYNYETVVMRTRAQRGREAERNWQRKVNLPPFLKLVKLLKLVPKNPTLTCPSYLSGRKELTLTPGAVPRLVPPTHAHAALRTSALCSLV